MIRKFPNHLHVYLAFFSLLLAITKCTSLKKSTEAKKEKHETLPKLVEVRKIWDQASHNAFTDLVYFQNRWFCVFREAVLGTEKVSGATNVASVPNITFPAK